MSIEIIEKLNKKYRGKFSEGKLAGESNQRYLFRKKIQEKLKEIYTNITPSTADILSKKYCDKFFLGVEYVKKEEMYLEIIAVDLFK